MGVNLFHMLIASFNPWPYLTFLFYLYRRQLHHRTCQFRLVSLAKPVLITALLALNNLRRDPIEKVSGALIFARYQQYIWWVHNRLGEGVRKAIPACTVKESCKNYTSEDGKYSPFMESTEDENRIGNGK